MHDSRLLSDDARTCLNATIATLDQALAGLPARDQDLFHLRLRRWFQNLYDGLLPVYGERADFEHFVARLVETMARIQHHRPEALKRLDIARDLEVGWFQHESMLGYVLYVEQFADSLAGVQARLEYLQETGATYLHLMKVMSARPGENDGGYAVVDYALVDPALGTNADLQLLCEKSRARGMSVCVDLVLNHCAREHPWAVAASAGDPHYQQYFYLFDDRTIPDAYEQHLPEVFPDFAPGNFSFDTPSQKWVWTTFNEYQWDLNWSNPEVFLEICQVMFELANLGVEVFRLDAVAFMWKRMGTDSQNQEEVFDLMQALRTVSRIATPAVAHKAEAIVAPDDLIRYFGVGRHHGKVSNIAYHNSLMVHFWSSLATRDTRLMTEALSEFPRTPNSIAWATYIRCHDDIGWAVADDDAHAVGLDGFAHRRFLSDFYSGEFPGSHARGVVFQHNRLTGDRRINGTFASLAGLEQAIEAGDARLIDLSVQRILMGHALICGFGGLALIYMGDELGLLNDYDHVNNPARSADSRWVHRPRMDWARARRRADARTLEGRLYQGLQQIVRARKRTPQLSTSYDTDILDVQHVRVFALVHRHPLGNLVGLYNFTEVPQSVAAERVFEAGVASLYDTLHRKEIPAADGFVTLPPYGRLWLI